MNSRHAHARLVQGLTAQTDLSAQDRGRRCERCCCLEVPSSRASQARGPAEANQAQISQKRKFVADGVFYAELHELLLRTFAEDGYARVEVRMTPILTEIIIRATRLREVLVDKGRRIHELTAVVQ